MAKSTAKADAKALSAARARREAEEADIKRRTSIKDYHALIDPKFIQHLYRSGNLDEWRRKMRMAVAMIFYSARGWDRHDTRNIVKLCMPRNESFIVKQSEYEFVEVKLLHELQRITANIHEVIARYWLNETKKGAEYRNFQTKEKNAKRATSPPELQDILHEIDLTMSDIRAIWAPIAYAAQPEIWTTQGHATAGRGHFYNLERATHRLLVRFAFKYALLKPAAQDLKIEVSIKEVRDSGDVVSPGTYPPQPPYEKVPANAQTWITMEDRYMLPYEIPGLKDLFGRLPRGNKYFLMFQAERVIPDSEGEPDEDNPEEPHVKPEPQDDEPIVRRPGPGEKGARAQPIDLLDDSSQSTNGRAANDPEKDCPVADSPARSPSPPGFLDLSATGDSAVEAMNNAHRSFFTTRSYPMEEPDGWMRRKTFNDPINDRINHHAPLPIKVPETADVNRQDDEAIYDDIEHLTSRTQECRRRAADLILLNGYDPHEVGMTAIRIAELGPMGLMAYALDKASQRCQDLVTAAQIINEEYIWTRWVMQQQIENYEQVLARTEKHSTYLNRNAQQATELANKRKETAEAGRRGHVPVPPFPSTYERPNTQQNPPPAMGNSPHMPQGMYHNPYYQGVPWMPGPGHAQPQAAPPNYYGMNYNGFFGGHADFPQQSSQYVPSTPPTYSARGTSGRFTAFDTPRTLGDEEPIPKKRKVEEEVEERVMNTPGPEESPLANRQNNRATKSPAGPTTEDYEKEMEKAK